MRKHRRKNVVYVGLMDLEMAYDGVNRETLWQVLRIYDVGGKMLSVIKSMYVTNLACVRVTWGESECFRINSGVTQVCIMSPWFFNVLLFGEYLAAGAISPPLQCI